MEIDDRRWSFLSSGLEKMLQEILEYGPELHRKNDLYNFTQFEKKLNEVEKDELKRFRVEMKSVLREKICECDAIRKKEEKKLVSEVNKLLCEEARRIRTKEWLKNQSDFRISSSKGKRELQNALISAKASFAIEKTDALQSTLNHLDVEAEKKEQDLRDSYTQRIKYLNGKFDEKYEEVEKNRHQRKEEAIKRISDQIGAYEEELNIKRESLLNTKEETFQHKRSFLQRQYELEKEKNEVAKEKIYGHETKEKYVLLSKRHIIETFKQFVRATNNGDETKINDFLDLGAVT